ncbi:hypothetical protein BC828DRAFT_345597 [Blastocladiella britannica]|nr:hypothetical protein BC828DRAFT_345597 [Blastocladiella britannica]
MEQPSFTPCTTCGSSAGAGASFPPPRVFGSAPFSHEETARIQMDLSRKLPPDCIATRSGGSAGRVSYVEGWKAIELANEIFGFNGWSSTVLNMSIDYLENAAQNPNEQKWSVGVSCTIRVTLRDGAYREDTGFGLCENMRTKGQALEKARKESATDALKRALRLLGNALGNCLSDKDFMRQVGSLPVNRVRHFCLGSNG